MGDLISAIGLGLKIAVLILEKQKDKPVEQRREALADLDSAYRKAKEKKDSSDLSKWFGGKL
jgi:hypothetical protein